MLPRMKCVYNALMEYVSLCIFILFFFIFYTNRLSNMPANMRLIFTAKKEMISGHERTYNLPSVLNSEIGAIVDDVNNAINNGYRRDIVVKHVGGPTFSIPENHRLMDPLTYPLLFPGGDDGWGLDLNLLNRFNQCSC